MLCVEIIQASENGSDGSFHSNCISCANGKFTAEHDGTSCLSVAGHVLCYTFVAPIIESQQTAPIKEDADAWYLRFRYGGGTPNDAGPLMNTSTRTSEGTPTNCPVCGKQMIVSNCSPLGDATCPHCGSLVFQGLQRDRFESDDEKKLADLGILVETNDLGEIMVAELHGPRFNDKTIPMLAHFKDIPVIKLCNTGLTQSGIDELRRLLPQSVVKEI